MIWGGAAEEGPEGALVWIPKVVVVLATRVVGPRAMSCAVTDGGRIAVGVAVSVAAAAVAGAVGAVAAGVAAAAAGVRAAGATRAVPELRAGLEPEHEAEPGEGEEPAETGSSCPRLRGPCSPSDR